jgi:Raf kinase inhibitor-like YbhB/YbcL family protein
MAEQGFTLTSPSFEEGQMIPMRHSCESEERSPALAWFHVPMGTRSFALIMDDPDAPGGTFTHWVLFDIPASTRHLEEGHDGETGVAGRNDFQYAGYGGPCPPPGHGDHRYHFRLCALDVESLDLAEDTPRDEVEEAMKGHVVGETRLMGRYSRS